MTSPPDSENCRVALCQIETIPWDVAGNLKRTLQSLEQAAVLGAHLAITPECVLNGYPDHTMLNRAQWQENSIEIGDATFESIRERATRLKLDLVFGFAERAAGDNLHNTASHITARGEVAAIYRKVHCRNFENSLYDGHFEPGSEFGVSTLRIGNAEFKLGLMICFDREITESVRCLRSLGAQLVACPLATDTADLRLPPACGKKIDNEQVTRTRAAENEVSIVVVNHAQRFNGGSFAVGPLGEVIGQLGAEPEVRVMDIPLGTIMRAFHDQPLGWMGWGYRRPEVYRNYLK